jgi:iron(III) transport system ATP-binding protein
MVFQSYALFPHYNVYDNIAYGLKLRKVPKKEMDERIAKILDLVELTGMESRMTNQLSGGQQQRVAIARAIVGNPKLLLADEPTGALDTASGVQIMDIFRRLSQRGITIIMITHELGIAQCADKIYHILDGRLHTNGVPQYTPKEEAHEEA